MLIPERYNDCDSPKQQSERKREEVNQTGGNKEQEVGERVEVRSPSPDSRFTRMWRRIVRVIGTSVEMKEGEETIWR